MNLFYTHLDFHGDATDVPVGIGPVTCQQKLPIYPMFLLGRRGQAQWCQYLAELSLGSFLLLFSKH